VTNQNLTHSRKGSDKKGIDWVKNWRGEAPERPKASTGDSDLYPHSHWIGICARRAVAQRQITARRFCRRSKRNGGEWRSALITLSVLSGASPHQLLTPPIYSSPVRTFAAFRPWPTKLKGEMGRSLLCVRFVFEVFGHLRRHRRQIRGQPAGITPDHLDQVRLGRFIGKTDTVGCG
jgi:hypothetical protein